MRIIRKRNWHEKILCQENYYTPTMQKVLQDIESYIEDPVKVLKDDPTSTVVVIEVDSRLLVVKRANTKGWIHVVRRIFTPSRAMRNWQFAHKLLKIGLQTFTPVAIKEERFGPLRGRSYFMCTYIQGIDALNYFALGATFKKEWKNVANRIALMIDKLAVHWLSHRDLNLSNIILVENQPWLIDLDSMRQHGWSYFAKRGAKRERKRFMENWSEVPQVLPETVALFREIFTCD
ncbi:MAG: hypothetical protein JSS07_09485 [Proteobacteria bacterium]|nr:hypothetical protein [Pseudomonadota bacterium]